MASRGINKVIIVGNLGNDPEVRHMPNGGAVTNISVATSESWKDKNTGQEQSQTEWHKIIFFNRLAEIAGEYLKKGSKVYIEGRLQTRKWQDKSGQDRYTSEIVANDMQMLDSRGESGAQSGGYGDQSQSQSYQQQQPAKAQNAPQQAQSAHSRPAPPPQNQPEGAHARGAETPQNHIIDDDLIPF